MSLVVMKFGGTSVGSSERIRQAAQIVQRHAQGGSPVAVVVSAMSKVTDLILVVLNSARTGNRAQMEDGLAHLQRRHEQVVAELFTGPTWTAVLTEVPVP